MYLSVQFISAHASLTFILASAAPTPRMPSGSSPGRAPYRSQNSGYVSVTGYSCAGAASAGSPSACTWRRSVRGSAWFGSCVLFGRRHMTNQGLASSSTSNSPCSAARISPTTHGCPCVACAGAFSPYTSSSSAPGCSGRPPRRRREVDARSVAPRATRLVLGARAGRSGGCAPSAD